MEHCLFAATFNNYVEIEKWVSELHDDYADSIVASVFAVTEDQLQSFRNSWVGFVASLRSLNARNSR